MTLDFAINHARECGERMIDKCDQHQCGLEHIQLSEWLSELREKRDLIDDYRKLIPLIIDDMKKFINVWKPEDDENIKSYEASLMMAYENMNKLYEDMRKNIVDKSEK